MTESQTKVQLRFSEALAEYVREDIEKKRSADLRDDVVLIITFLIDQMGDPVLRDFDQEAASKLDKMLPDIPNRENIPKKHTATLSLRYEYAKANGWTRLRRLTESRIRSGFHTALARFFDWAIEKGHYPHARPVFSELSEENLVPLPRDSFEDDEIELIFTQALFTGCKSVARCWQPGPYFVQSHIYWAYLLSLLTGMRAGEIGRIKLDDIKEKDGIFYLYLRGFDPTEGRVARKDIERYKTEASWRVIPLHPLLLDLGLLERADELRELNCPYLFPEWEPYQKPNGEWRWGQPATKSWQYLKRLIKIERKDVALYSTRHWFADLVDNTDIKDATRRRLMGHKGKTDVPSGYGAKNRLTTRDLGELAKQSAPAIERIMPALLEANRKAESGDLIKLKPWLQRANWSAFYRRKLGLSSEGG
jgi:integrase